MTINEWFLKNHHGCSTPEASSEAAEAAEAAADPPQARVFQSWVAFWLHRESIKKLNYSWNKLVIGTN